MRVKNLTGTTPNRCSCGSWLVHWKNFSRRPAKDCSVIRCPGSATVGGHVQKDSPADRNWYVVPLCDSCNSNRGQDLEIYNTTVLVPANVKETCEKWMESLLPH